MIPVCIQVTLDQPLSTLKALIEADLKVPAAEQVLLKDGQPVRDEATAAIGTLNIKDGDMLYVVRDRTRASGQASVPYNHFLYIIIFCLFLAGGTVCYHVLRVVLVGSTVPWPT